MIKYISKYRKQYSYLLLAVYLFLVALSVFHSHHIEIRDGNYQFTSHSEKQSGTPIDEIVGLDSECIVSQFTSTVSTFNYIPEIFCGADDNKVYVSFESSDKLFCVILFKNNPLRAPPSVLPS